MKKTTKIILVTVLIMATLFTMILVGITGYYNSLLDNTISTIEDDVTELSVLSESVADKYAALASKYEDLEQENAVLQRQLNSAKNENKELASEYEELENQVWNVMHDYTYDIEIERDGKIHNWTSDGAKWFPSKSYTIFG